MARKYQKYNLEIAKKMFEDAGCTLLAKEYINVSTKMDYICSCGEKGKKSLGCFMACRHQRCIKCRGEKVGEARRITDEEAKEEFKKGGFILLEENYKRGNIPMKCICPCGEIVYKRLNDVKGGQVGCKKCLGKRISDSKLLPYEEVKKLFEENGLTLLEEEYKGVHEPLKCICICGRETTKMVSNLKAGKIVCTKCAGEVRGEQNKFSLEEVQQVFEEAGCTLISTEYINNHKNLDYICECGNFSSINLDNFKGGHRCKDCGTEKRIETQRKYTIKEVGEIFSKEGYKLLNKDFPKGDRRLKCECPEGHIYKVQLYYFEKGVRCRQCYIEYHRGENHHQWNPDKTDEERILQRSTLENREWVKTILAMDNYTCQCCGEKGGTLNAHHILNYGEHKELRFEIDNGITFCEDCHVTFHKTYGYRNNNREQLEDYLEKHNKLKDYLNRYIKDEKDDNSQQLTLF